MPIPMAVVLTIFSGSTSSEEDLVALYIIMYIEYNIATFSDKVSILE